MYDTYKISQQYVSYHIKQQVLPVCTAAFTTRLCAVHHRYCAALPLYVDYIV